MRLIIIIIIYFSTFFCVQILSRFNSVSLWHTVGSKPRPALARMIARAMFLSDVDHLKSMYTPSVITGMFLSRKPISSIPTTQQRECESKDDPVSHTDTEREQRSPVAF